MRKPQSSSASPRSHQQAHAAQQERSSTGTGEVLQTGDALPVHLSPVSVAEQRRLSLYSLATKEPAPLLAYAACTTAPESACDTANRNITGEPGRPRHHGGISE